MGLFNRHDIRDPNDLFLFQNAVKSGITPPDVDAVELVAFAQVEAFFLSPPCPG